MTVELEDVLLSLLTPEERRTCILGRQVEVTGSEGGRYRVTLGHYSGNITWLEPDSYRSDVNICAHPSGIRFSNKDCVLTANIAQIQVIKFNEVRLLTVGYPSGRSQSFLDHK